MRYRVAQSILRGAKDKPAKPRIKREDTLRDVEIPRSAPYRSVAFPPDRSAPKVYEMLPSGYPKGTGFVIGPRLIKGDKPIAGAQFRRPFHQGSTIPTRIDYAFAQNFSPSSKPRYRGKVVMLINEQAISQAEHTCLLRRDRCHLHRHAHQWNRWRHHRLRPAGRPERRLYGA
jgi:hypothetical protein